MRWLLPGAALAALAFYLLGRDKPAAGDASAERTPDTLPGTPPDSTEQTPAPATASAYFAATGATLTPKQASDLERSDAVLRSLAVRYGINIRDVGASA